MGSGLSTVISRIIYSGSLFYLRLFGVTPFGRIQLFLFLLRPLLVSGQTSAVPEVTGIRAFYCVIKPLTVIGSLPSRGGYRVVRLLVTERFSIRSNYPSK